MIENNVKPRIGVLALAPERFRAIGTGTENGAYWERQNRFMEMFLKKIDFADISYIAPVYNCDDLDETMELFHKDKVDMVLTILLSWADDYTWARFLRDMPEIPILFMTIARDKMGFENNFIEDGFAEFICEGGLVGAMEASGDIKRMGRKMVRTFFGKADDAVERIRTFASAAKVRSVLKKAVVGLLPSFNEVMWSTYLDPYLVFRKLGPEVRFITVAEVEDEIEKIDPARAKNAMDELLKKYPSEEKINYEKMLASVIASLAVEDVAKKRGTDLVVLNDIDPTLLKHFGLRPGFLPTPENNNVFVVPEGDIGGGLACLIMKLISSKPALFMEPFLVEPEENILLAGHGGPHDFTDPNGKTIIANDARFAKSSYKHAGAPFAWHLTSPGEKTMFHLSQDGDGFTLVASVVDALPPRPILAGYSHGLFKIRSSACEFFSKWLSVGVTQHFAIADGDWIETLKDLAFMLDTDITII